MLQIALNFFFIGIGMWSGWLLHKQHNIDYKKRWQESFKLLGEERTKTLAGVPEEPKAPTLADQVTIHQLRERLCKLPPGIRVEAEEARLDKLLPPVDDLSGLPPGVWQEMVETRLDYGYDEMGRKFR